MSATIRIDPTAHALLSEIAQTQRVSLTEALSRAVEAYRRQVFLSGVSGDYAALHADPKAWAEELAERSPWDMTTGDGLQGEPSHLDGRDREIKKPKNQKRPKERRQ